MSKESPKTKEFVEQVALVTGGSTGIGASIARHFAERGAQVLITGRNVATLRESSAQHPNIAHLVADVAQPASAVQVIEEVNRRFGRLDILINNAGIAGVVPLADAGPDHVRSIFDINVAGLIETTRLALPLLRQSKGAIVNISSVVADEPFANMSVYSASKAAVLALTRSWAQELAADGIRVNAVSPGPIETPIFSTEKLRMSAAELAQMGESILSRVPAKRFGKPDEVAEVVSFLASQRASFVTGAQYKVGGGIEA
jgi:NAD(P)-dependent dehydrogenase (short-subunit alcohol dehydrogenase family)